MSLAIQILFPLFFSGAVHPTEVVAKKDIEVVDFEGLEAYLGQFGERTVVVNFWATWCVPCVKELPFLDQVSKTYDDDSVVVVLVSLDFANQIDTRLKPFLKEHQLDSRILLLDDPDQNTWIDKVDPEWSGAIPVTQIRKGDRRELYQNAFQSFEEINTIIQSFLNS